jgi:hypothetical protein
MLKTNCRSNRSGEGGLAIVVILVLMIGAAAWWLFSTKSTAEKEGKEFVNEAVQHLAVQHDLAFLESKLGPNAKMELSPPLQKNLMGTLTQLGVPEQPIAVEGKIEFESQFFQPHGLFIAQLNYPGRPGKLELEVSHPVGRWQLDAVRFALASGR